MVKRTLIAIAVVALLMSTAQAAIVDKLLDAGDSSAVKVEGKDQPTIRWPYEIVYKELDICTIPIKMEVGYYVKIIDCDKKKIILKQVPCGDIGVDAKKYPCYNGCVDMTVVANFEVKLGSKLAKNANGDIIIGSWKSYYVDDVVPALCSKVVTLCVDMWEAKLENYAPTDEVEIGSVTVTVKPN